MGAQDPREAAATHGGATDGALRSFVTLAYVDELDRRARACWPTTCRSSRERDDATLAIAARGLGEEPAVLAVATAADGAGVDVGRLPDVMLDHGSGTSRVAELEQRANAVLTRRDEDLAAPAWQPEGFARLRLIGRD